MDLHRAEGNDWDKIPAAEHNIFQEIAASTDGFVTPANIISVAGGLAVSRGLNELRFGNYEKGFLWITFGLTTDLVDGKVAHLTGTKSPKGEFIDAAKDKLVLARAIPTLTKAEILPKPAAASLAVQGATNSVLAFIAKRRGVELHPSKNGKTQAALQAMSLGAYVTGAYAEQAGHEKAANTFKRVGTFSAIAATAISPVVALDYASQTFGSKKSRKKPLKKSK